MGLKDTFKNLFNYFEVEDANEADEQYQANSTGNERPAMHVATTKPVSRPVERPSRRITRGCKQYRSRGCNAYMNVNKN